ncbi:MAG: cytochrome c1, partial [Rhodoferax sp.]
MKKLALGLMTALAFLAGAQAAELQAIAWDKAPNQTNDLAALQTGAKLFVNYCLNCHSAAYMRYTRLQDLGLSEKQIKDNLLFTDNTLADTMTAAIDPKQAKAWFGTNPPDLTLVARSRAGHEGTGADYLDTYWRTFYRDDTKATGWNNLAFPNVAMPNVLWELQGQRKPIFETVKDKETGEE